MSKFFKIFLLLLATVFTVGCKEAVDTPELQETDNMVKFVIHVYAGDPDEPASRSDNLGTPDAFVRGSYYEQMHTLRIVIVRPDNTVEHNEYLYRTIPDEGISSYPDIRFRVVGNENKKVFLFANEASMKLDGSMTPFNFNAYPSGSTFPVDYLLNATLTTAPGTPLIDNRGASKTLLPMTEMFDIFVPGPTEPNTEYTHSSALFITRTPVKFGFYFTTPQAPKEAFTVEEIVVSDLADCEYLIPRDAEYAPAKELLGWADRYIYDYSVPPEAVNAPYTFRPGIQITPETPVGQKIAYEPKLYFPETSLEPGKKYSLKIKLSTNEEYYGEFELPNLPKLPRNTFVKVNVQLQLSDISFTVDVLPYTAVPLEPVFGFEELLPRPPYNEGPVPPWITIDPNKK